MVVYYKIDKKTKCLSWIITAVVAAVVVAVWFFVGDDYLRAWVIAMLAAVTLLYALSIPRKVKIADGWLEIKCTVELTRIAVEDIKSIRRVEKSEVRPIIPLLGSYGFWGYYGYYADMQNWDVIKVYATEWNDLVMIEDIYETKFLISCRRADELIAQVYS